MLNFDQNTLVKLAEKIQFLCHKEFDDICFYFPPNSVIGEYSGKEIMSNELATYFGYRVKSYEDIEDPIIRLNAYAYNVVIVM